MSHSAKMDAIGCDVISSITVFFHAFANVGGGFGTSCCLASKNLLMLAEPSKSHFMLCCIETPRCQVKRL